MPTSKKIVLIGDSYGCERIHNGVVDVPPELTFPELVKNHFQGTFEVQHDFLFRRKLVDCPAVLKAMLPADWVFVHAGIVDCFPRPLSEAHTQTQQLAIKTYRKLITQPFRREILNYVNRKYWSSKEEIFKALENLYEMVAPTHTRLGLITVVPINKALDGIAPGAQEDIFAFNDLLRAFAQKHPDTVFIIDAQAAAISRGYQNFIHPDDCHLNKAGNRLVAEMVQAAVS